MKFQKCRSLICLSVMGCILLSQASCSGKKGGAVNGGHASGSQTGVNDILQSELAKQSSDITPGTSDGADIGFTSLPAYTSQSVPPTEQPVPSFTKNEEGVEVDLTELSSGAIYSVVYDMMIEPENYVGKVVKMKGLFDTFFDETTGIRYYACVIKDATQCCAQGIEFDPVQPGTFPDDYPELGQECTVVGTFDVYKEGEQRYVTLRKANMTFSKVP